MNKKHTIKLILSLHCLIFYSQVYSQNLKASKKLCYITCDSVSAEAFNNAIKPDTYIRFEKNEPEVKVRNGIITILLESKDTITLCDINKNKKVIESSFWIRNFSFLRSKSDFGRFTYLGYSEEFKKHVVFYELDFDFMKTNIFIDGKTGDRIAALTQPVFSPNRKMMVSFLPGRRDLGHDILIQEIEEDEITKIFDSPVYKLGDWDIKEIRWLDNETLVIKAKRPKIINFSEHIKQKTCYYKLSLIKCN